METMMTNNIRLTIKFAIPEDATPMMCKEYVEDALTSYKGGLPPYPYLPDGGGHPMSNFKPQTLTVWFPPMSR